MDSYEAYEIKEFNLEVHKELNSQYIRGEKVINIVATGIVLRTLNKVL